MTRSRPRKPTKTLLHVAAACMAVAVLGGATSTESYWSERNAKLEQLRVEHRAAHDEVERLQEEVRDARRAVTATRLDLADRQARFWERDMMERARRNAERHAALDLELAASADETEKVDTPAETETKEKTKKRTSKKRKAKSKKSSSKTSKSPKAEKPKTDDDSGGYAPAKKPRKDKIVLGDSDDPLG